MYYICIAIMQIIKTTTIMTTEQIENRVNQQLLSLGLKQKDSENTHDQETFDYYIEILTKIHHLLKIESFILSVNTGDSSKMIIGSNITIIQFEDDYLKSMGNKLKKSISNILLDYEADSWVWHSYYGTPQLFINFPY